MSQVGKGVQGVKNNEVRYRCVLVSSRAFVISRIGLTVHTLALQLRPQAGPCVIGTTCRRLCT